MGATIHHARCALWLASILAVLSPFVLPSSPAAAQVPTASVSLRSDRTTLAVGEVLQLEVRVDANGGGVDEITRPDFNGFSVVGEEESSPMSFSFGFGFGGGNSQTVVKSSTVRTYLLRAETAGRYRFGPIRASVGRQQFQSKTLTVDVTAGNGASSPLGNTSPSPTAPAADPQTSPSDLPTSLDGARFDADAFVQTYVDNKTPYVGEQVTVAIYFYTREPLQSVPAPTHEARLDGFWTQDLLPAQRTFEGRRVSVNGQPFYCYLMRKLAAFPLHKGPLAIEPPTFRVEPQGDILDMFNLRVRGRRGRAAIERAGIPVEIQAKEIPGGATGVHVGQVQVEAKLEPLRIATGEATALTVVLSGTGSFRDDRVVLAPLEGVRILEPEISDTSTINDGKIGGRKTLRWLLIADKPGVYELPPAELRFFDPATEKLETATSARLRLEATGPAQDTTREEPQTTETRDESPRTRFGPISLRSQFRRPLVPLSANGWYLALLAVPGVAFVVLTVARQIQGQEQIQQKTRERKYSKALRASLKEATNLATSADAKRFYPLINKMFRDALEKRLGSPIGSVTYPELRKTMGAHGMSDDLCNRIIDELEGLEFAQYSSAAATTAELDNCLRRITALLDRVHETSTPHA